MKYKCPKCNAVAEIDLEKKTIIVEVNLATPPSPQLGSLNRGSAYAFPSHQDCEFNKAVDEIDLEKLEKVEGQPFLYTTYRGVPA